MPDATVDLRSDTVTRPTPAMRRAMADAEVGDDAYGEDPTVNALQDAFAARVGKEAALLVPSGTMANQLALRLLSRPGTLVVAGRRSHVIAYENGAGAYNTGAQSFPVDDGGGILDQAAIAAALAGAAHHQPVVSVVCAENTHMASGGTVAPTGELAAVVALAGAAGGGATGTVPIHLDGARLWNAEVATGRPAAVWAAPATTVMCCLSKGLAAPVGSLLAGPSDLIAAARVERQRLGGAMRQAGVLAAAGLVAMETMVERLAEDHRRAATLAEAVADRWPGAVVEQATNIVVTGHPAAEAVVDALAAAGVRAGTIAPGRLRLVTHVDVDDAALDRARAAIAACPVG